MLALLAELTIWGWVAVTALSASVIFGLEIESGPGTACLLALGLFALWFAQFGTYVPTPHEAIIWVGSHWLTGLVYFGYYVCIGVLWSVAKWWRYNVNGRANFLANETRYRMEFQKAIAHIGSYYHYRFPKNDGNITDFVDYAAYKLDVPPMLSQNKARIVTWMGYWPWSALWTILNDPLRKLLNFLYDRLGGVYTAITRHVFDGVVK